MELRGRVRYSEFETLGAATPMEELLERGELNADMLAIEYGDGPSWVVYVGWWRFADGHTLFGMRTGAFWIQAFQLPEAETASIEWEARSLDELWPAIQLIDRWLADRT
jgi:transcriptional regulator GlxA family with amidase domain